ncbi:glutamine amidotransferase [Afifella sp. JA880]|uniref:glutamine amidotransferase n=1 Tax=Afifella sp. JA880 TaxID=2975280 RepID=UPI0021BAE77B|nr:glutamine amidotransferase [Afifella sp. JA880]MCT8268610.1 glutamine amidotransferase [Afifella sp. JA880]
MSDAKIHYLRRQLSEDAARRPVLVILHQETSSPGKLGQMLQEKGYPLDIRRPRFGDPLPETMADHSGAVIFGGPMSANDTDDFVKREIDWINVPLKEKAPFLGICLGAQMLVKTLGGEVKSHCEGCAEIGFYRLDATPEGAAMMDWPSHVYQWHREGFDLPTGATLLARGELFQNQAFSLGPAAFGVQFHSELTYAMACRWTVRGAERMNLPGARPRPDHMAKWFRYDPPVRRWLDGFLDSWIARDGRARSAQAGEAGASTAAKSVVSSQSRIASS